jgi:hypothetical protein
MEDLLDLPWWISTISVGEILNAPTKIPLTFMEPMLRISEEATSLH